MVTVRLGEQREKRLRRISTETGKPMAELIREGVDRRLDEAEEGQTLDVVLADVIGSVAGRGEYPADQSERLFGEILEEKRRSGHL